MVKLAAAEVSDGLSTGRMQRIRRDIGVAYVYHVF